jgi:hypothetical protein
MQQMGYRFIEACALLPMLFVPQNRQNAVFCTGAQAETFAAHCLRWRDVNCVYLREKPIRPLAERDDPIFKDKTKQIIVAAMPPVGSCAAVLTSPGEDPDAYLGALAADGVVCVTRYDVTEVQPMLWHMRRLFPRSVIPWREYLPQEIYGAIASPRGVPTQQRSPPQSAKRLNNQYLKAMFNFGQDELPMVFGGMSGKKDTAAPGKTSHA